MFPPFFPFLVGAKEAFDFLFLHCLTFTLWALDIWKWPCQTHTHTTHAGQTISILCIKQLEGGTFGIKGFLLLWLLNLVSWLIPQSGHFWSRPRLAVITQLFVICSATIRGVAPSRWGPQPATFYQKQNACRTFHWGNKKKNRFKSWNGNYCQKLELSAVAKTRWGVSTLALALSPPVTVTASSWHLGWVLTAFIFKL